MADERFIFAPCYLSVEGDGCGRLGFEALPVLCIQIVLLDADVGGQGVVGTILSHDVHWYMNISKCPLSTSSLHTQGHPLVSDGHISVKVRCPRPGAVPAEVSVLCDLLHWIVLNMALR
jgi:hypothetical protein